MDSQILYKGIIEYLHWYIDIPRNISTDIASYLDLDNLDSLWSVDLESYIPDSKIQNLRNKLKTHPLKPTAFLLGITFTPNITDIILKHYASSDDLIKQIEENPYSLIDIEEVSFKKIDKVATEILRIPLNSPLRYKALVHYQLQNESFKNGHLFTLLDKFINSKFEVEISRDNLKSFLKELIVEGKIILEGKKLYTKQHYSAEKNSAEIIAKLISNSGRHLFFSGIDVENYITGYEDIQTKNINSGKWKNLKWKDAKFTLSDEQKESIRKFFDENFFIITGLPGTGKCFKEDTLILMFDGTIKKVQDIRIGDKLMGPDGNPRKVMELSNGVDFLYEVKPNKGDSYVVNSNHVLSLRRSKKLKAYDDLKKGDILNIPLKEYQKKNESFKRFYKGYRSNEIPFREKEVHIDPYILGYWLGDGHSADTRITTKDKEVISYFQRYTKEINKTSNVKHFLIDYKSTNTGKASTYNISTTKKTKYLKENYTKRCDRNIFLKNLKKYNLINNKHIPSEFIINSTNIRLQILAGLIDSDGEISEKSNYTSCSITLKNKGLIDDILFIARSLGFSAYYRKTYKACLNGKNKTKKVYHKALLSGDLHRIPTKIKYKKIKKRKINKNSLNHGITIKNYGFGKYFGFTVDKDHLFLLSDFTVVHNSTVTKSLVEISKNRGLKVTLLAPTGIAAKRLSSICDYPASTIHKELGFDGVSWKINQDNPISSDIIIIDEFSMVDQVLLYKILQSLPKKEFVLVFIGDAAQLPSVGPGNVLRELIICDKIPHVALTKIFRQEDTSDIVLNSHQINKGSTQLYNTKKDFIFLDIEHEEEILKNIKNIVNALQGKNYQVLSPTYKGCLGVSNLNRTLQELFNPNFNSNTEFKTEVCTFREGDKVMIIKNDYKNEVYNGESGTLVRVNNSNKKLEVLISGKTIEYTFRDAYSMLALDYIRTIHKAQGQEYDFVVMPFVNYFSIQLQRNLLYTAITRAKKKVFILGHQKALYKAIQNNNVSKRNTILSSRILTRLEEIKRGV